MLFRSGNRLLLDQALAGVAGRPQSIYEAQHVTNLGDDDRARKTYERALAIRERVDGESPVLILTLNNMADGMIRAKNPSGALVYAGRAATLAAKLLGRSNPVHHAVATTHAEALVASQGFHGHCLMLSDFEALCRVVWIFGNIRRFNPQAGVLREYDD